MGANEDGALPPGLDQTLVDAADQIHSEKAQREQRGEFKSLFPEDEISGPPSSVRHLITERDMLRLRMASARKLSPWVEASWAAVIAAIPAFLVALGGAAGNRAYAMTVSDFVAFVVFAASLPVAVVLTRLNKRGESVDDVCNDIEKRPRFPRKQKVDRQKRTDVVRGS